MLYRHYSWWGLIPWIGLSLLLCGGAVLVVRLLVSNGLALGLGVVFLSVFLFVGAVIGVMAYRVRFLSRVTRDKHHDQTRFVELLIDLLYKMALSDGEFTVHERRVIRSFFIDTLQFRSVDMLWVDDLIHWAEMSDKRFSDVSREFSRLFGLQEQRLLLEVMYEVGYTDGKLSESEYRFIGDLVRQLGIDTVEHARIRLAVEFARQDGVEGLFSVLGLPSTASWEDVRQAYRVACKERHPDRVHHLGEAFVTRAEKQMRQLTDAYRKLEKVFRDKRT